MSTDDNMSFMPPDEPTAVYPIGNDEKRTPTPAPPTGEPPEPPALSADILAEASEDHSESGFNPMIALALLGIPVVMGIGAVVLAAILISLK